MLSSAVRTDPRPTVVVNIDELQNLFTMSDLLGCWWCKSQPIDIDDSGDHHDLVLQNLRSAVTPSLQQLYVNSIRDMPFAEDHGTGL